MLLTKKSATSRGTYTVKSFVSYQSMFSFVVDTVNISEKTCYNFWSWHRKFGANYFEADLTSLKKYSFETKLKKLEEGWSPFQLELDKGSGSSLLIEAEKTQEVNASSSWSWKTLRWWSTFLIHCSYTLNVKSYLSWKNFI